MRPIPFLVVLAGIAAGWNSTDQFAVRSDAGFRAYHSAEGMERLWKEFGGLKNAPGFHQSYQYFLRLRTNQFGRVDYSAYDRALAAKARMKTAQAPSAEGALGPLASWSYFGPHQMDVPYRIYYGTQRGTSGRIMSIVFSVKDPRVVFAAGAGGGVFRSSDAGATWSCVSDSADWPILQVSSLALDPKNVNNVYAGTGGSRGFFRLYGKGIMRSTDGGTSWANLNSFDGGPVSGAVSDLAVDPDDPRILYATVSGRNDQGVPLPGAVYRSTDSGATFSKIGALPNAVWNDVTIGIRGSKSKPSRPIYVSGFEAPGKPLVYRSGNKGVNWTNVTPPGFTNVVTAGAGANIQYASVHVDASKVDFRTVYAQSGHDRSLMRSDDQGATWTPITTGFKNDTVPASPYPYNWSQSNYDAHLTASYVPGGGRDVLYSGLITLQASDDKGATWHDVARTFDPEPGAGGPLNRAHNDQHCLAFNPNNPNEVLIGCDGGIYKLLYDPKKPAGAGRWGNIQFFPQEGLNVTQFYDIAVAIDEPTKALGGTQDNATPRSYGAASPNDGLAAAHGTRWNNSGGGDGGYGAIDPKDTNRMYVSSTGEIWVSTDGWAASTSAPNANTIHLQVPHRTAQNESGLFLGPNALEASGSHLFVASNGWLYRHTRGAAADNLGFRYDRKRIVAGAGAPGLDDVTYRLGPAAATALGSGKLLEGIPNVVKIAPGDGNVVYVGTLSGKLYVSRNALDPDVTKVTFTEVQTGTQSLPANLPITAIDVHPLDPTQVFIGLGGTGTGEAHLWWCRDVTAADRTWLSLGDPEFQGMDIPVNAIALDIENPDMRLWVGNDLGVFESLDGGISFSKSESGTMWNVQVNALRSVQGYIYAGTFGRGMQRLLSGTFITIRGAAAVPNRLYPGNEGKLRVVLPSKAGPGGVIVKVSIDDSSLASLSSDEFTIPEGEVAGEVGFLTLTNTGATHLNVRVGAEERSTPIRVDP